MTDQFHSELFINATEYEEEPLRDRKRDFPNFGIPKEKRNFVKRVIAMANTARLFGKPAYLLYGIDDDRRLYGLKGGILETYGDLSTLTPWESVREKIRNVLLEYITPLPTKWHLKHGTVNKFRVAYLLVEPMSAGPFKLKRTLNDLLAGQCWIRFGESLHAIEDLLLTPNDDLYAFAYCSVPYLLPSAWKKYTESILNDHDMVENPIAAQDIWGYQDLSTTDGQLLQDVVTDFLISPNSLLVIEGTAGSGKSAFVWRWVSEQAEAQLQAVTQIMEREEYLPPGGWIPVYHRLRNAPVRLDYQLDIQLLRAVNTKSASSFWSGRKQPSQVEQLFCRTDLSWLICLDGLDEIRTQEQQSVFIEALRSFLETYPRVKLILTTRPDASTDTLRAFGDIVTIAPLDVTQVTLYLNSWLDKTPIRVWQPIQQAWVESTVLDEFIHFFIHLDPELQELSRKPAYLEAAVRKMIEMVKLSVLGRAKTGVIAQTTDVQAPSRSAGIHAKSSIPKASDEDLALHAPMTEDAPEFRVFEVGEILDRMYRDLWLREKARHSQFGAYETVWWEKTGKLALVMDGDKTHVRETRARETLGPTGLRHLLSLGILERIYGRVNFNTDLTKAYFAASWLQDCLETNDLHPGHLMLKSVTVQFRQRVCDLLQSLTRYDIEPLFHGGER